MDYLAIQAAEAAVNAGYPMDAEGLLIVELDGETKVVENEFISLLEVIEESCPYDIRISQDDSDRMRIWKGRKSAFSAVGRLSPDYIVQDGVVPRSKLSQALREIKRLGEKYDIRVANVFHAGDGNLHPLILFDGRHPDQLDKAEKLAGEILNLCLDLGGSITGEHGIGMEKRDFLPKMFTEEDIDIMRTIRLEIDPDELSNRGKMFPDQVTSSRLI
jgi:glycolate oxidase